MCQAVPGGDCALEVARMAPVPDAGETGSGSLAA